MIERIRPRMEPDEETRPALTSKSKRLLLDESFTRESMDKILIDPEDDQNVAQLERGLSIDENQLNKAVTTQPDLYYRVSKALALAISRRDAAKQHLANVEARVDGHLRRAARESETKRTEDEIKSLKRTHADVVRASNLLLQLSHSAKAYEALEEAYRQRSYAVNKLIENHIANFYSDASHNTAKINLREARAQSARQELDIKRKAQQQNRHIDAD